MIVKGGGEAIKKNFSQGIGGIELSLVEKKNQKKVHN